MTHHYVAVVRKAPGTSYGIDFPDLPGLVTGGETLGEAIAAAETGLAAHVAYLERKGEMMTLPRPIERLAKEIAPAAPDETAVAILVTLKPAKGRQRRISVTIDENLLARIDAEAAERGTTRSALLADGARRLID